MNGHVSVFLFLAAQTLLTISLFDSLFLSLRSPFAQICISNFDASFIKVRVIAHLIYSEDICSECMHLSLAIASQSLFSPLGSTLRVQINSLCTCSVRQRKHSWNTHTHARTQTSPFISCSREKPFHIHKGAGVLEKKSYIKPSEGNPSFAQQYVNALVRGVFDFIFP